MSSKSTTKTTLALIPYLNCEPFYAGLKDLDFEIVHEVPRKLGELADSGVATCGPMSLADLIRLRETYEPLEDFGIACEGAAHSVLLFTKRSLKRMDGAHVGLTAESSTGVLLARLVMERRYGLKDLTFANGESEDDDARVLIGDRAIVASGEGLDDFPFVADLGQEWHGWQALPFVFARWAVHRDVPEEDRKRIAAAISASLAGWKLRVPEIAARRGDELGLDGESVLRYLNTFRYRIGPVETMGEQTFESMLKEMDE